MRIRDARRGPDTAVEIGEFQLYDYQWKAIIGICLLSLAFVLVVGYAVVGYDTHHQYDVMSTHTPEQDAESLPIAELDPAVSDIIVQGIEDTGATMAEPDSEHRDRRVEDAEGLYVLDYRGVTVTVSVGYQGHHVTATSFWVGAIALLCAAFIAVCGFGHVVGAYNDRSSYTNVG